MAIVAKETASTETKSASLRMDYETFLNWTNEDIHAEWVEGEVIIHRTAKPVHQATLRFLLQRLGLFVDLFDLGKIYTAPLEMKVKPGGSSREPDILFIAKENLERLTQDHLAGPADLIIEIVSDDSVSRDRDDKFKEYRQDGIREYWIIDPRPSKHRADFYALNETGDYRLFATEDEKKVKSYVVPGFWLRPAWLWQADSLNALACALEIEGVAAAITQQVQQAQPANPTE